MRSKWLGMTALLLAGSVQLAWANPPTADERANIRTQLAAEYFKRRQYGVAMEEAKKALAVNSRHAPAHSMLALINMELQEDGAARGHFQQALSLAPNDPDIRHNYGFFLCDRGEHRAGISELLAALKDPLYATPEKSLVAAGECAEKAKQPEEARGYYLRALRYRPDSPAAKLALGNNWLAAGNLPEARRYLIELNRVPGTLPPEVLWLGVRVERKLGNEEGEKRYADQLRRQYPDTMEATRLFAGQYDIK